jgi:uncharacterized protein (TIGR03382 family)
MHARTWIVFAAAAAANAAAHAEFIIKDPMRDDQGWTAWDSKVAFSDMGMSVYGIVTRDVKEFPSRFDAVVTIDASKSIVWGFGVAGTYAPDTGYSGIGFTANADPDIGVMFAIWDHDKIIDMVRIDADADAMLNKIHRVQISVRDDVAFAAIDGRVVAKIGYNPKLGGSQIVFASFSDNETYFRDLTITAQIPAPGAWCVAAAAMAAAGVRRRRQ